MNLRSLGRNGDELWIKKQTNPPNYIHGQRLCIRQNPNFTHLVVKKKRFDTLYFYKFKIENFESISQPYGSLFHANTIFNRYILTQVCKLWRFTVLRLRWLSLLSFERKLHLRLPIAGSLHEVTNSVFSLLLCVDTPVLLAGTAVFLPYK